MSKNKDLLPKKVKILHRIFNMVEMDNAELIQNSIHGNINFVTGDIKYTHVRGNETVDTVVHEILHGLWNAFDLPEEEEEHIITTLATGIVTVMDDNPTLFPTLQGMLTKGDK